MFVVACDQTGDYAAAPDELCAMVAARVLLEDAYAANRVQGFDPTATFYASEVHFHDREPVNGLIGVGQPAIWRQLGIAGYRS